MSSVSLKGIITFDNLGSRQIEGNPLKNSVDDKEKNDESPLKIHGCKEGKTMKVDARKRKKKLISSNYL